jgi:hypothetical protein
MNKAKKNYHYPENLRNDYYRKCKQCGNMITLNLSISNDEQPEYWTCGNCGCKNKTFWTPLDELRNRGS